MVRIEIQNFQSIAREVVEVDGFSAVVGRSNIGKSAVVRAIKAALTGSPVDAYVRHGEDCQRAAKGNKKCQCFCAVRIQAEGFDLLWEKGDNINRYVFNGDEHTVVGKGTPDFLMDGFGPVKLGDEKDILQIAEQFQSIFILNKSGTVVADVLSDVAKLDEINTASRFVEKDRKEAVATRRVREKDIKDLEGQLESYEGLDEAVSLVSNIEDLERQTDTTGTQVIQLERFIDTLKSLAKRIKLLDQVSRIEIPDIDPIEAEGDRFTDLSRFNRELVGAMTSVQRLEGVENIELPNIEVFLKQGEICQKLTSWRAEVEALKVFFDKAQKYNAVELPFLEGARGALEKLDRIAGWQAKATKLSESVLQAKQTLERLEQEEIEILGEFQELGVCRTCNRPFAEAHQHA